MKEKQHEKYTVKGESPFVRVTFLIQKEHYRKLQMIKKKEGVSLNFFAQKAIERALKEHDHRK